MIQRTQNGVTLTVGPFDELNMIAAAMVRLFERIFLFENIGLEQFIDHNFLFFLVYFSLQIESILSLLCC